jgi:hypothetical protein
MATKLTKMTHKIAIQLHLVAESWDICISRCRRPVRKLLDTPLDVRCEIEESERQNHNYSPLNEIHNTSGEIHSGGLQKKRIQNFELQKNIIGFNMSTECKELYSQN